MPVRRKATGKTSPAAAASWPGDAEPAGYGQRVPGPKGSPRGSGESVERTMNATSALAGAGGGAGSVVGGGGGGGAGSWGGGGDGPGDLPGAGGPGELGWGRGGGTAAAAADLHG